MFVGSGKSEMLKVKGAYSLSHLSYSAPTLFAILLSLGHALSHGISECQS